MKRFLVKAILTAACMALTVCDGPVGLGEKILMNGPVVTIGEPAPNRASLPPETDPTVGTLFMLSGAARDELRVTSMLVTLDYWNSVSQELVRMERAWRWDGKWLTRESDGEPWRPYTGASYNLADADPDEVITDPSWKVYNKNDVRWSLPIFMNRMEKGDYFVNVSAWNSAGRHDARSAAKLQFKYSNQAPTVRITNPVLLDGGGSLAEPQPPSWDGYVFDPVNRPEETSLNLRYYTNSFKDVCYEIESYAQAVDLSFEIANQHNIDSFGDEKTVYYDWQWGEGRWILPLPERGIFTDRAGVVGAQIGAYVKAGDLIELSAAIEESLPRDSVTPMQIITRVLDDVGLEERKSKGWFLYLPDSDRPYPDINFAHRETPELASMTRGSANYNSLAYDDDGVKELQWTLYRLADAELEGGTEVGDGVITFAGGKKESWTFTADKKYGTGRFRIVVRVQDIYDVWGYDYQGYFTITSNATPTIVTPLASPSSLTATFWGDSSGNFTIAGRAQIEDFDGCDGVDHGVRVHEVAIVWLKPGLGVANNFRYSDPNDPLWAAASEYARFTDAHGNKIWKTGVTFDPATVGNGSDNFQEEWIFSQTLNYFTDLDIGIGAGKLPFTEQQFRIHVSGGEPFEEPRASVYSFTARGDMAAPVVNITHIVIQHGAIATSYSVGSYNTLPSIAQNDQVMLKGTWSDDSIAAWAGLGANRHTTCLSALDVSWDGENRKFKFDIESFTLDSAGGGNWETGWHTFDEHNTDPIIQLAASITDIGGRPGTGSTVLVVETADPVLVRVSSAQSDGYYGEHKQTVAEDPASRYIDIFLDFNKPVTFLAAGGAPALTYANAPRLALNNGGEAFYESGDATARIVFRYFVNGVVNPPLGTAAAGRGGGNSPVEAGNQEGRLNVSAVVFNGFGESAWQSLSEVPVIFQKDGGGRLRVCDPTNIFSLAGQKRIVIDKTPPAITGVATFATREQNHGRDSQINIEVSFNKSVSIAGATPANTYLTLTGGNLDSQSARALFEHSKDSSTLNFLYTVANGHDTSAYNQFLGVSNAVFGGTVVDLAGNALPPYPAIPGSPAYLNGVVIDTVPPDAPIIYGINRNQTYYSGASFYIGGLEPGGGMVEYHLNHAGETETGWTAYAGVISGGQTGLIPLTLDGVYSIAARQYDTATTPNVSAPSPTINPVRLDSGGVLERMRSAMPDGSYSAEVPAKSTVTIDLEFRVPLTLGGAYSAINLPPIDAASIIVNTSGGATNRARLSSAPANSKKWTFEFAIPHGASTPFKTYLDVTEIDLDGIIINDQYGTRVNGPNGWIKLGDIATENRFSSQKKMTILAGRPHVMNPELGGGIVFTGTQLRLEFDRDIYRGKTTEKLMIRQINDGYKIPAVLSEEQYNGAFINREDIFTGQSGLFEITPAYGGNGFLEPSDLALYNTWRDGQGNRADTWRSLGEKLYQTGYNGATPKYGGWPDEMISDTTLKYILYYDADPDNNSFTDEVNISGAVKRATMNLLRVAFRASEAHFFAFNDSEIRMEGSTLTVDLSASGRLLPVKGARYEWVFPNGFVQDALGTANGTGEGGNAAPTGNDTDLTSGNTPDGDLVLFYASTADPPAIRIDKGSDIPAFNNNTVNRQALQPLTARVKINSRTPNATVTYQTSTGVYNRKLTPAVGFVYNTIGRPERIVHFQVAYGNGSDSGGVAVETYVSDFTIGSENYLDGGMTICIRARSTAMGVTNTPNDYGYEAAYRSVLIYNNYPTNATLQQTGAGTPHFIEASLWTDLPSANLHLLNRSFIRSASWQYIYDNTYANSGRDRVFVRGSNTLTGDTSIPNFPLSRDLAQSRKAMLLTPLDINAEPRITKIVVNRDYGDMVTDYTFMFWGYVLNDDSHTEVLTEANIPTGPVGTGHYLWAWVTWNLNVPAYVEFLYGELPADASDPYQTPRTNLRYAEPRVSTRDSTTYKMSPGVTTVVGATASNPSVDFVTEDISGHIFNLGIPFPAPPRSD